MGKVKNGNQRKQPFPGAGRQEPKGGGGDLRDIISARKSHGRYSTPFSETAVSLFNDGLANVDNQTQTVETYRPEERLPIQAAFSITTTVETPMFYRVLCAGTV